MTILQPVRQRLSAARLYALVVPAPFTPPDALVRRVEDLVSAGAEVVQLDLAGWQREDAVNVLNRCNPVVVPTGRLLVVGHAADVAADLGADALLLGPVQELPAEAAGRLGSHAAIGREVGDEVQVGAALESGQVDFLVLIGGRAAQVAARAHQLAPLDVPDAYEDPQAGSRPWFVDLGPQWPDPTALPERACRVRFHVFVPADSPVDDSSPQLRGDVADLSARVAARWDHDEALVARRERVLAQNSAASRSFTPAGSDEPRHQHASGHSVADPDDSVTYDADPYDADPYDPDPYDPEPSGVGTGATGQDPVNPYDSEGARNHRGRDELGGRPGQEESHPIRDFLNWAFHRGPSDRSHG